MSDYVEHPSKVAFCPILFGANGGRFDSTGKPIVDGTVAGLCDSPFDCGTCPHLQAWVSKQAGKRTRWECYQCVTKDKTKEGRELPGFYQSAPSQGIRGCAGCGRESSLLQLVFEKVK